MIRIIVSAAAYEAILATVSEDRRLPPLRSPQGDFFLWLNEATVNRLTALRGPGEGYSEVILRLAQMEHA
jgi:hypothetical protein